MNCNNDCLLYSHSVLNEEELEYLQQERYRFRSIQFVFV